MSGEERMEIAVDEKQATQKVASKKGGLRTMPFIIGKLVFFFLFTSPLEFILNAKDVNLIEHMF